VYTISRSTGEKLIIVPWRSSTGDQLTTIKTLSIDEMIYYLQSVEVWMEFKKQGQP